MTRPKDRPLNKAKLRRYKSAILKKYVKIHFFLKINIFPLAKFTLFPLNSHFPRKFTFPSKFTFSLKIHRLPENSQFPSTFTFSLKSLKINFFPQNSHFHSKFTFLKNSQFPQNSYSFFHEGQNQHFDPVYGSNFRRRYELLHGLLFSPILARWAFRLHWIEEKHSQTFYRSTFFERQDVGKDLEAGYLLSQWAQFLFAHHYQA